MYARKVAALLKPNSLPQFNHLMESKILPWLREQEGFVDLITLVLPDGKEVASISFWDRQADAETHAELAQSMKIAHELKILVQQVTRQSNY